MSQAPGGNNDQAAQLLERLRDIHAAPEPGWWPPAPGWWALAALVLMLLTALGWRGWRAWQARRRRARWLAAIDAIDQRHPPAEAPARWLADLNGILKIVALRAFPRADVAGLHGRAWAAFLAEHGPGDEREVLAALDDGRFAASPAVDAGALKAFARHWVRRHA